MARKTENPGRPGFNSAPERIRTSDLRFRRPTLYPAELRALERRASVALEQRLLPFGRVHREAVGRAYREGRRLVGYEAPAGHEVRHRPAVEGEDVGHEPAVAAPPLRLRAHHRDAARSSQRGQPGAAAGELVGAQVVGVAAEGGDLPAVVRRALHDRAPTPEL